MYNIALKINSLNIINKIVKVIIITPFVLSCSISYLGNSLRNNLLDQNIVLKESEKIPINIILNLEKTNSMNNKYYEKTIKDALLLSGLFSIVNIGKNETKKDLEISIEGNYVYGISHFFSFITFYLLPGFEKEEIILTINIFQNNEFIKQYKYKNYRYIFYHFFIFLILTDKNNDEYVKRLVIKQLILEFTNDFKKENLFTGK